MEHKHTSQSVVFGLVIPGSVRKGQTSQWAARLQRGIASELKTDLSRIAVHVWPKVSRIQVEILAATSKHRDQRTLKELAQLLQQVISQTDQMDHKDAEEADLRPADPTQRNLWMDRHGLRLQQLIAGWVRTDESRVRCILFDLPDGQLAVDFAFLPAQTHHRDQRSVRDLHWVLAKLSCDPSSEVCQHHDPVAGTLSHYQPPVPYGDTC